MLLTGSASTAPIANISISTIEGGWDYSEPVVMNLGNVPAGNTTSEYIRICKQSTVVLKDKYPLLWRLLG